MRPGPEKIGQDVMNAVTSLPRVQRGMLVVGYDFKLTHEELCEIGYSLMQQWEEDCHLPRSLITASDVIRHLGGKQQRVVNVSEAQAARTFCDGMAGLQWYFDEEGAGVDTGVLHYENPDKLGGYAELRIASEQGFALCGHGPLFEKQLFMMGLPVTLGKDEYTL